MEDKIVSWIQLDISGTIFKTKASTLQTIPSSRLAKLNKQSPNYDKQRDIYVFDHDPEMFRHILNVYRDGEIHVSNTICPKQFQKELKYWQIPIKLLSMCCWKQFYEPQDDIDAITTLIKQFKKSNGCCNKIGDSLSALRVPREWDRIDKTSETARLTAPEPRPNSLWLFLEEPTSSIAAKIYFYFYLLLVITSLIIVFLWTNAKCRVDPYLGTVLEPDLNYFDLTDWEIQYLIKDFEMSGNVVLLALTDPHPAIFAVDIFCMLVFSLDVILGVISCPNKKQYLTTPGHVIKAALCIAMVVSLSLELNKTELENKHLIRVFLVVRSISVARLLLIFRLRKLYQGLDVMLLSIESSFKELLLLGFFILIFVTVYGTMMFSAEIENDDFKNIWVSMWWALITMTTVGYGDFYPRTDIGYIVGTLCAISGLIVLALPVAAIATNFARFYCKYSDYQSHHKAITDQDLEESQENHESQTNDDNSEEEKVETIKA